MISYGYTIIYVEDIEKTLEFYSSAFDFEVRFKTPELDYAELVTGSTVLSFAQNKLAQSHFDKPFVQNNLKNNPPGFDLGFITEDVEGAYSKALDAGAEVLAKPEVKPWNQTVAYIRDINGIIIEIATPISQ